MYLLTRKNKIIDYCEHGYINIGNMIVCESKGCTFDEATIVYTEKVLPLDIDSIPYDYINGEFIKSPESIGFILDSISVTTFPDKLEYRVGERFDSTGMKVTARYTNGFSFETTNYTISPDRELNHDDNSILITTSEGGITVTTSIDIIVYSIYGVSINLTNSNPSTSVAYTDDARGMIPGSDKWDNTPLFKGIKPCVLNSNHLQYYLDPDDFSYKEDGSKVSYTNMDNVMIEIPKLGYKISTEEDILTVQVTDHPNAIDKGFRYYAHTIDTEGDRDYIYIGAYLSSLYNNRYYSVSGKYPSHGVIGNVHPEEFDHRDYTPSGYELVSFYAVTLLQCLFILRYKSLDHISLGRGYLPDGGTGGLTERGARTGGTDLKGMYYGDEGYGQDKNTQVKFAGIEDFYGNYAYRVDGVYISETNNILITLNGLGNQYLTYGQYESLPLSGYVSQVQGTTEKGFLPMKVEGSSTTYFKSRVTIAADSHLVFGAHSATPRGGVFCLDTLNNLSAIQGVRIMYRGDVERI